MRCKRCVRVEFLSDCDLEVFELFTHIASNFGQTRGFLRKGFSIERPGEVELLYLSFDSFFAIGECLIYRFVK